MKAFLLEEAKATMVWLTIAATIVGFVYIPLLTGVLMVLLILGTVVSVIGPGSALGLLPLGFYERFTPELVGQARREVEAERRENYEEGVIRWLKRDLPPLPDHWYDVDPEENPELFIKGLERKVTRTFGTSNHYMGGSYDGPVQKRGYIDKYTPANPDCHWVQQKYVQPMDELHPMEVISPTPDYDRELTALMCRHLTLLARLL